MILENDDAIAAILKGRGDSAFPVSIEGIERRHWDVGLSKREWFAGMALQGLLASAQDDTDVKNAAKAAAWVAGNLIAELEPAD